LNRRAGLMSSAHISEWTPRSEHAGRVLRFLEQGFGVEVPYNSEWRRNTVGDLTGAFDFAAGLDMSDPQLPILGIWPSRRYGKRAISPSP
jgi:phospholipase C